MWPRARVRTRLVVNSPCTVAVYCDDAVRGRFKVILRWVRRGDPAKSSGMQPLEGVRFPLPPSFSRYGGDGNDKSRTKSHIAFLVLWEALVIVIP